MHFCPCCGNQVSEKAKFCQECGMELPSHAVQENTNTEEYEGEYDIAEEYPTEELPPDLYDANSNEADEEELYSRENRKTLIVGVVLAGLICIVGIGLYFVVSNMLKQEHKIDVGSGLSDKQVQVTVSPSKNQNEGDEEISEGIPEGASQDEGASIQGTITENTPNPYGVYQQAGIAGSQESSVLEDGGVYHVSGHMVDGNEATSWQEGSDGDGSGEWVLFQLDREYSVRYLTFKMGNWKNEQLFYANNRPAQILLKLDEQEFYLDFPDGMTEYTVELSEDCQASSVWIQILSVYDGANWPDCCISEMTVYGY